MSLVKTTPAHAEALAELHRACFETNWDEAQFIQLLNLPTTRGFVCEDGFILYSHVLDEMEVMTFCVLPEKRKQGIGTILMNALFDDAAASDVKHVFLEVSEMNPTAQKLYEKLGFDLLTRRAQYYKTKDGFKDALCFVKKVE